MTTQTMHTFLGQFRFSSNKCTEIKWISFLNVFRNFAELLYWIQKVVYHVKGNLCDKLWAEKMSFNFNCSSTQTCQKVISLSQIIASTPSVSMGPFKKNDPAQYCMWPPHVSIMAWHLHLVIQIKHMPCSHRQFMTVPEHILLSLGVVQHATVTFAGWNLFCRCVTVMLLGS